MKRFVYSAFMILLAGVVSCATYPVKKEINESGKMKGTGKVGVIVRVSQKGRVPRDEIVTSISKILPAYRHKRAVDLIVDVPSSMTEFMDESDSFYQQTASAFLPYKSIGVMKSYLRGHESEISSAMGKNGTDLLVVYEIYTVISVEMQMMKFSTVLAVVDKNLDIVYLDHQTDTKETENSDMVSIRNEIVNHITDRFVEKMKDFNWLADL